MIIYTEFVIKCNGAKRCKNGAKLHRCKGAMVHIYKDAPLHYPNIAPLKQFEIPLI